MRLLKNWKFMTVIFIVLFECLTLISHFFYNDNSVMINNIVFPFMFLIISFYYSYNKKIRWEVPFILFFGVLANSYFLKFNIDGYYLLGAFLLGEIANFICYRRNNIIFYEEESEKNNYFGMFMPILILVVTEIAFRICTFGTITLNISFKSFIVVLIILYCIYGIVTFIFRNTFRSTIVMSVVALLLFIINQSRIFYTSDTLLLSDIGFLKGAGETVGFIDVTFVNMIKFLVNPTIFLVISLIFICYLSKKFVVKCGNRRLDLTVFIGAIIVLTLLFTPNKKMDKFIIDNFFKISDKSTLTIDISNTKYYGIHTIIGGMYGKYLENGNYEPKGYDEKELSKILKDSKKTGKGWGNPNVIVVFSESFFDINRLEDITFDKDVISNFRKLSNEGKLVQMLSPVYGGFSANVEFQIMTGGSMNYYPKGFVPYMQLYSDKSYDNPSVVREFNNNGYYTKILNSSGKYMFNCDNAYDKMKVKERRHLYTELKSYVTDEYLTDEIIKEIDKQEEPLFMLTVTMGGHMPYYKERYDIYNVNVVDSKLDEELSNIVLAYAEGIYKADQELGRLYEYIRTIEEDTIIVFFGDHLPYLQAKDGKDILDTSYFNTSDEMLNIYRRYNTEALIVSNYDIDYDERKYLSPDLLMPYILNNLDIELSNYYSYLYNTIDILPSSNKIISSDKDGNLYYTRKLPDDMKKLNEEKEKIQYMLFK